MDANDQTQQWDYCIICGSLFYLIDYRTRFPTLNKHVRKMINSICVPCFEDKIKKQIAKKYEEDV